MQDMCHDASASVSLQLTMPYWSAAYEWEESQVISKPQRPQCQLRSMLMVITHLAPQAT